jgi:mono/diheme cytochrome c family protein
MTNRLTVKQFIRRSTIAGLLAIVVSSSAAGASPANVSRGEQIFDERCVFCHAAGPGHPGTQELAVKHSNGKALIQGRSDLTPIYIRTVVRNGLIEMPPFRPSEISDRDLDALIRYLTTVH